MTDLVHSGPIVRESEFVAGLTGACGPNAAASLIAAATGGRQTPGTLGVYNWMRARSLCDPNGASAFAGLIQAVQGFGCSVLAYPGYVGAGWPQSVWLPLLKSVMGHGVWMMETANGQALVDSITGQGENAVNLQFHFITGHLYHAGGWSDYFGRDLPEGFGCADGDNGAGGNWASNGFRAANQLQFYPIDVLAASQPAGAIVVSAPQGGTPMIDLDLDPNNASHIIGAHDHADPSKTVGEGIANDIAAAQKAGANIQAGDILVKETYEPTGTFSGAVISWPGNPAAPRWLAAYSRLSNVHRLVDFSEGAAWAAGLANGLIAAQSATSAAAQALIDQLQAKLDAETALEKADGAKIATLQQQLATAQAQLAAGQVDAAAIAALKQALA